MQPTNTGLPVKSILFSFERTLCIILILLITMSCARSKVLTSTSTNTAITIDGNANDWPVDRIQLNSQGDYDLYFSNDDEFLYVFVGLKNNALYQNIQRYGLYLYFDATKDLRRSFGILYPVGVLNVLSEIPGARKEYLENPGWANAPENERLIKSIEDTMADRVMIVQRTNKRDPVRPVPINPTALQAQSLELAMDRSASVMYLEMKIPLSSSRTRQFAIDAKPGDDIHFGFEVVPPTLQEIMGDSYRSEEMNPTARDPYGSRVNQSQRIDQQMTLQLRGEYTRWNRIRLE
jgi:hypothetical protein